MFSHGMLVPPHEIWVQIVRIRCSAIFSKYAADAFVYLIGLMSGERTVPEPLKKVESALRHELGDAPAMLLRRLHILREGDDMNGDSAVWQTWRYVVVYAGLPLGGEEFARS